MRKPSLERDARAMDTGVCGCCGTCCRPSRPDTECRALA